MARLHVGEIFPDFTLETPFEKNLSMAEIAAKAPKGGLMKRIAWSMRSLMV